MFDSLFQGALMSLVMVERQPFYVAVPHAIQMAMHAVEYLRAQGVNVDSRVLIEGGVQYAPPQPPPQPQAQYAQPQQAPNQAVQYAPPQQVQQQAVRIVPQQTSHAVPTVEVMPPQAIVPPDLAAFISERLDPARWVAEENLGDANQFLADLQQTFGVTLKSQK
jgi:hypothetical protein